MPPINPSATYEESFALHQGLYRRAKDLQEYQLPRLQDCASSLSMHQQLVAELREAIEVFQKRLQVLESLVDDQETDTDRAKVQDWVEEMTEIISQVKRDARAATLASKRKLDLTSHALKDELLRSNASSKVGPPVQNGKPSTDDALMRANNDVTEALHRTTTLMQQELERSVLATQMLNDSSRTLHATSDLYSTFGTLLQTSKTLIIALERSDTLDRMLIISSLVLFLAVVTYILKVRVIDKGIWLAFWWVKYLPSLSGSPGGDASSTSTNPSAPAITEAIIQLSAKPITTSLALTASSLSVAATSIAHSQSETLELNSEMENPPFTPEYTPSSSGNLRNEL